MDFAETITGVGSERFGFFTLRCDFKTIFNMKQLVLENCSFSPPKGFVLYGFHVEILLSLEDLSGNLTPVLGGDRFFNVFFVRFWASGGWFSRTALLGLQKALFYKVSMLKCYCGSRLFLSTVLLC